MKASDAVLVVGGYGAVGAIVSATLAAWFPGRVMAAGRHPDRVRLPGVTAVHLDVADRAGIGRVLDKYPIRAVVLCVEPPDITIAQACLSRGVHLIDVGASDDLLRQTEGLTATAVDRGATAVLSVGVAPGLTNLLARRVHDQLGGAGRIEITLLLGAGEHHGRDAVTWTLSQLGRPSPPGVEARRVSLPGYGRRTAHPLAFSDQYSLRRTLQVPSVTTRFCLDSALLTAALFGLRRLGAFRTTGRNLPRRAMTQALTRIHIGGTRFAVRVDGYHGDRHATCGLTGDKQSHVTARIAAYVTGQVLAGTLPTGVHHIDQLPQLADLPEQLTEHDITLWPPHQADSPGG